MNASRSRLLVISSLFVILGLSASAAWAYSDTLINIDPSEYPDAFYRILLDTNGDLISGEGFGYNGTWYYYPASGYWRHWFYNQPYDPDREGYLDYRVFITANDYSRSVSFYVNFGWCTPAWSVLGRNHPPLPEDAPNESAESLYIDGSELISLDSAFLGSPSTPGSVEPNKRCRVQEYNPDWVSIDVKGRNIDVLRGALRECRAKQGACYDPDTGDCYTCYEEDCSAPYRWQGSSTTCGGSGGGSGGGDGGGSQPKAELDFGDAPNSYATTLASNGPRHTIVPGVFLGTMIDGEADGKPGPMAAGDGDDDGVAFTSDLAPGESVGLEVTASTPGYLNAWVDFDRDGTFNGRDEQIFADTRLVTGVNRLSFRIPAEAATGDTYARFRFNTRGLLPYYGPADDGEVEDYKVTIAQGFEPQVNSGKGGLKWSQPAQSLDAATPFLFNGWDELSNMHLHQIVADDWQCSNEQAITGFQWWGSFQGWTRSMLPSELPLAFHIGIWTDASGAGHPDTLAWEMYCTYWTWNVAGFDDDPRGTTQDETCFQFTCLLSQDQWFYPTLSAGYDGKPAPAIYWLSIAAVYDTDAPTPTYRWGWTTRPYSFNSAAAHISAVGTAGEHGGSWPPVLGSQWLTGDSVEYPRGTKWDMAFELLTNQASQDEQSGTGHADLQDLAPIYRFWSGTLTTHFYTISESEKDYLIQTFPSVWTYEGIAFYAFPPDEGPVGVKPVYRFWSNSLGRHYYTISETDRDQMMRDQSSVWTYEGVAWDAFDAPVLTQ
jgi:hypothetical protein